MTEDAEPKEPDDYEEFARIKPSARPRSPVLAAVVIALGGIVIYHLIADLRYALTAREPVELGDAAAAVKRDGALRDNTFVRLSGVPDRANGLRIEPRGDKSRLGFYRVYGTASRVYVRTPEGTAASDPVDRWTGRLRRFDALPFGPSLREHYAKTAAARRHFDPAAVKVALDRPGTPLVDRAGEPATLGGAKLTVAVESAGEVVFYASRGQYPAAKDAVYELEQKGIKSEVVREDPAHYVMVARLGADRTQVLEKLDALGVEYERRIVEQEIPADASDQLKALDWAHVTDVSIAAPIAIADDAWVLLDGETPQRFLWVPIVSALLLAFVAFNLWYLVRRRAS